VHAAGVHRRGQVASEQVVPRSIQSRQQSAETRRCQVAEETHGPRGGRAQEGRRAPPGRKVFPDPLAANAQSLRLRLGANFYLEVLVQIDEGPMEVL
jgi:hypothetical protein